MERLLLSGVGVVAGLSVTALSGLLGLQSSHWNTLATINALAGVSGALTGHEVVTRYRKATRQQAIAPAEIDRAVGVISERYALKPSHEQILVALQELRGEVNASR